jgi:SynChlorMet cassette protein ScmC
LIVRDPEGRYFVHPFPTWSNFFWKREERTWDVQKSLPLSGVFFIKKGKRDEIIPMGGGAAASCMYQSAQQVCLRSWRYFSPEDERAEKKKLFANACRLAQKIPAFTLHVSLQGQFWKEVEKVIYAQQP